MTKNTSHKQNVLNMSHNIGVGLNAVYTQNDHDFDLRKSQGQFLEHKIKT